MLMLADILLVITALIALLIASLSDLKTREVPDYVSFGLIGASLGIRLVYSAVYFDWMYFVYGLAGFGLMFGFGAAVYYTRQWGGGDAKLLMGLGSAFATSPYFASGKLSLLQNIPFGFLLVMLTNMFIIGAVYGLLWSLGLFLKNLDSSINEFKLSLAKLKWFHLFIWLLFGLFVAGSFFVGSVYRTIIIFAAFFILVYFYLFVFVKSAEKVGMVKNLPVEKLTEGDWVAETIRIKGKVICTPKDLGLEKWQINAIKKARIKSVLVKEGIAFVPALFLGLVVSLLWGNLFFNIIY